MAQRKTPPRAPAPAVLDRVGPYTLGELLRRDRFGEVYRGEGPQGPVRVRVCPAQDDPAPLSAALDAVAAARSPTVAPVLDQLADDAGRVAVVTPLDRLTLAERRKLGRLDATAIGPLGCALLDGLAALHAAGVQHGAVTVGAVGIDEEGAARWQDAGLQAPLSHSRMSPQLRAANDVSECAALLRDLGRLPVELEAVLDPVASGVPGAPDRAEPLAAAWRTALAKLDMPVPPPGVRARVPGLLGPPPKPVKRRAARRPVPGFVRVIGAVLLILAALAVTPAAALGPGGRPLLERIDAYAPPRKGMQLDYRLLAAGVDVSVTLRVTDERVVAGVLSISLQASTSLRGGAAGLPLGLAGGTVRVNSDSIVRTAAGGSVRDLVLPLAPGTRWRDRRTGSATDEVIEETRTVLGPVPLDVAAGHFDRCVAVSLASATRIGSNTPAAGQGVLWYCPGVGLAHALLQVAGETLSVDLVSVH